MSKHAKLDAPKSTPNPFSRFLRLQWRLSLGTIAGGLTFFLAPESLSPLARAVAGWRGDELLLFGDRDRREKIREDLPQRLAHPDIEKIRQVSIANIVIVWRVC